MDQPTKIRVYIKLLADCSNDAGKVAEEMKVVESGPRTGAEYFVTMLDRSRSHNDPQHTGSRRRSSYLVD